jgi:hypothetical protein
VTFAPFSFRAPSKWVIPMKPMPIIPMRIMCVDPAIVQEEGR